jgi:hypothetical protein
MPPETTAGCGSIADHVMGVFYVSKFRHYLFRIWCFLISILGRYMRYISQLIEIW